MDSFLSSVVVNEKFIVPLGREAARGNDPRLHPKLKFRYYTCINNIYIKNKYNFHVCSNEIRLFSDFANIVNIVTF